MPREAVDDRDLRRDGAQLRRDREPGRAPDQRRHEEQRTCVRAEGPLLAYAARSASTIFIRAARAAGRKPPTKPIASANSSDATTIRGVSVNENAISANVWKLVVEIDSACMTDAPTRPTTPPSEPEQQRLAEERREDRAAREAERAQRADLGGARRHARVHRDHGADDGADREDDRDRRAEVADEVRQLPPTGPRRTRVSRFASSVSRGSVSMLALDRVEAVGIGEPEEQRRKADAAKRLQHLLGVAPDLGVEAGAAGVEHADDRPVARGEAQRLAEAGALEAAGDRAAGDDLGGAGPEHPPLDEPHLRPQREPRRRHAADHDVRRLAGLALRQVDQHDRFLRDERLPVRADRDLGQALDDARLQPVDAALHLGLRRRAGSRRRCRPGPVATSVCSSPAASISTVANT